MNRFNLTFSGEILTGYNPADVRRDFGKLFAIDDPERLESFFSGQTIILRRNLERKDAADFFHQLNLLGAVAALVKVNDDAVEAANAPEQPLAKQSKPAVNDEEKEVLTNIAELDPNAQVWAVSSRRERKTQPSGKKKGKAAALDSGGRTTGDLTARIKARLQETQRQAEEDARPEAERAALQKQAAEVSARQAEFEEKQHLEAEEAALLKAELEEKQRREAKEAALLKAELEEKQRREAKEAALLKAELEEKQRLEAEEAVRLKAELEEKQRREAEEAARHKAELEEKQRLEAEEAARRKAELEEKQRREAEEAARHKAGLEKKQRREAEEAARRKAELEEKQRREAEEAVRRKAELEEKQRREAEEAVRLKAELEEKQRHEAEEEKQRREAEEAARRKAEIEEKQRLEAEEAVRLKAELEEKQRLEAEEAARRRAELEEKQRLEAEEAARRRAEEEFRQLEAEEAAGLKAELEEIKRQEEAEAQRIREDARRRQLEAEENFTARLRAARSELQLEPLPEKPRENGTSSVNINALRRTTSDSPPLIKKRQPGEPNLYTLRPFRNTREIRARCEQARGLKSRFYALGVIGLALSLITAERFLQPASQPVTAGVNAVASDNGSGLVLLSGKTLLLHDRAGVATDEVSLETLGLLSLSAPLAFDPDNSLIATGTLASTVEEAGSGERQLLRCDLETSACQALAPALDASVDASVINPIDGAVITAGDSGLVKIGADGQVIATAEVTLPEQPILRLHAGLLFINSAEGPGISVYRYEDTAFGKQLDEILLLPPAAVEAGHSRVGDFIWSGGAWWASLYDPKSGSLGVYRFDDEWNSLGNVELPFSSGPIQLAGWGEKTLVNDLRTNALQRYNTSGEIEIPFLSSRLDDMFAQQKHRVHLEKVAWRGGLLVAVLLTIVGFGLGILQGLRQRVYKPHRERGAAPVDEDSYLIQWIEPLPNRPALLRYRSLSYGLLGVALLLLGVAANVSVWQLAALMLVLTGPGIALMLLARQPIGYIGILGNRLLLVDHSGMYHIAGGSGIQYRGPYLLIDDVAVFCGNLLFPAFQSSEVRELLQPVTTSGVKVDRKTVLVKLLQGRHPLALGAGAILISTAAAAILLSLQGIF